MMKTLVGPVARWSRLLAAACLLCLAACRVVADPVGDGPDGVDPDARVPARGSATTFDVASWNIEFFGDPSSGPSDEALQLVNVRDVIGGTDFDLWGLQEVVDTARFDRLVSQLPGYAGFLANDPSVVNGPAFYSDFDNLEQKVGLVFKPSIVQVLGAAVILTQDAYAFAGRPPLEVKLRIPFGGGTEDVVVIVFHSKCCTDSTSYERRVSASSALKTYLDATYPTQKVWVIGDWNDDIDISISDGLVSPYQNFVADPARYVVQSKALSEAGLSSTVRYSDVIDHHMSTHAAAAAYVAGSVEIYRVDAFVPGYGTTTSDHFPVLSRYALAGGGATPAITVAAPSGAVSGPGPTP